MTLESLLTTLIIPGITGAVTAGVPLYIKFRRSMNKVRSEESATNQTSYEQIRKTQLDEIARLEKKIIASENDIEVLRKEVLDCAKDRIELRAEQTVTKLHLAQMTRMAAAQTSAVTATLTADTDGVIVEADDWVRDVLGWRSAELVGQAVDVIVPRDIRPAYRAGMVRVAGLGVTAEPGGVAVNTFALTKDGRRVPIVASMSRTYGQGGQVLVASQIVLRRVFDENPPQVAQVLPPPVDPPKAV